MRKVYDDIGLSIEVDSDSRVWLSVNDEYYFNERQLQQLLLAFLNLLYPSKVDDTKTEYHDHPDGVSYPKIPWLLR